MLVHHSLTTGRGLLRHRDLPPLDREGFREKIPLGEGDVRIRPIRFRRDHRILFEGLSGIHDNRLNVRG